MAVHHPHLLDFSPPPSTVAMEAPPPSFDHGQLLALHVDGTDMLSLGGGLPATHHRVLADDTAAWPPPHGAVPLSLYNYGTAGGSPSSLFSHGHQQFAVPPEAVSLQAPNNHLLPTRFQLRSSKYLGPGQDLLAEFCSLLEGDLHAMNGVSKRSAKAAGGKWDDVAEPSSSSGLWGHPSLSSMDLLELERRKSRLLSMVEEVDRRYRRYREQMRAMEVSFEAVAGAGASQVYTRLALRAMSRHFRCLRDALVAQVRALRKAGAGAANKQDDDYGGAANMGATKGETPRLRVLDQCLRQQRAFQHPAGSIENYPWRPQRGLPERAVAVLRAWLFEHFLHPYPNDVDKHILARQTGLSRSQVSNWFINARVRLWKPMIEDMYTDEVKVKQQQQSEATTTQNPTSAGVAVKPEQNATAGATMGGESHHFRSTTSVRNNPTTASMMMISSSSIVPETDGGDLHLFSTSSYPTSMHDGSSRHGGAVSLTLGLQQQQQPFAPPMMPHHHHQQQRSSLMLLQGEEEEEPVLLPYSYRDRDTDLTGSQQLLHHLAG